MKCKVTYNFIINKGDITFFSKKTHLRGVIIYRFLLTLYYYMDFKLTSKYKPTGDQPEAIRELTEGIKRGDKSQVC